jgi:hypothetical protein
MARGNFLGSVGALSFGATTALFVTSIYAQEVPGCRDAWNDLYARDALGYARALIETDCPVMYRQGWLINPAKLSANIIPACVVAWNGLEGRGALSSAGFLVAHNCPVIERKGWRYSHAPAISTTSISVPLRADGGTFVVPILINNAITLNFTVDSGATDVTIPADVVLTLFRTGTLVETDFIGPVNYVLADGSTMSSAKFRIRSLTVGGKLIEDVTGSVAPVGAALLLGQSFLTRFRSWSLDNARQALVLVE